MSGDFGARPAIRHPVSQQ